MRERTLTAGDLQRVTGVPPMTLVRWCNRGWLTPANNGEGQGTYREFTVPQAVAVAHAEHWRKGGGGPMVLENILRCVGAMTERELLAEFRAGRTQLAIGFEEARLVEPPCDGFDRLDIQAVYGRVKEQIEQLAAEPKRTGSGRQRGLALETVNA